MSNNSNNANPGDTIKIITDTEEFEGVLMPRPELLGNDVTILKIKSGYNIGIDNEKIKSIKVLKEYDVPKVHEKKHKPNSNLPTVCVISLGGTISSKIDYTTGGVIAKYTADDFLEMCPELLHIANLKAIPLMSKMSEDFTSDDWAEMAIEVKKHLDDESISGIVLTQGTDTMHYTSAALSFMLQNVNKPVIVTGAQRSIDRGSTDAFLNLICSVNAAANFEGVGVFLCMHATTNDDYCFLHLGTKVRKMHTLRRDAFRSINAKPVAKVYPDKIEVMSNKFLERPEDKVEVSLDNGFEKKTALLYVYPGMDINVLDYYKEKGIKGLVIAATALGHVPHNMISKLKSLVDSGVAVVIVSQTIYGRVDPLVYSPLRELSIGVGCIFAEDMLPEVAYIKLGWVLSHTTDLEKVARMMHTNFAYEIDKKQDPELFLN
jgi:glutamyl-tRNA(Gln) amidotransferase subunit D